MNHPVTLPATIPPLPVFTAGALPPPEPASFKRRIRTLGMLAIAVSWCYLVWRAVATVDLSVWYVALPLMAAEVHTGVGLVLFTLALWDRDVRPKRAEAASADSHRLAILIPTYNEPEDVLLPTVAGAVAVELPHETWVLDDGRREWVRELAAALGVNYLARPDNVHAKAGNLNYALSVVNADLVGIVDADHVPGPGFLRETIGYFQDPTVAVVQTPQDFYNLESFEHASKVGQAIYNEEAVFYRAIAPAKNHWGAAFWCGTSAVVRVAALHDIGGVPTQSVTEDIFSTMRLNQRGWKAVYHNEVLARGLAPSDAGQYMLQRNRWAMGAMQVLRLCNPLLAPGFSFGQRLAFFTTLFGWFDSVRTLLFMLIPPMVLLTGASPINAPAEVYVPAFLAVLAIQLLAMRSLARGLFPPLVSLMFEVVRMPAVLPAIKALVFSKVGKFSVTPKGKLGARRARIPVPVLLTGLIGVNGGALLWCGFVLAGIVARPYADLAPVVGAAIFSLLNTGLLLQASLRIHSSRYATEIRAGERFMVNLPGDLNGVPAQVTNLSVTGAAVSLALAPLDWVSEGGASTLTIHLPNQTVSMACNVQLLGKAEQHRVSVEFTAGQREAQAVLARALIWGGEPPRTAADAVAA